MLDEKHFRSVLDRVCDQVFSGKGKERHGKDLQFEHQPWTFIAKFVDPGFLTGQSVKKIFELKNLPTYSAYEREILGAISYLVMALMYRESVEKEAVDEVPF